MNNDRTLIIVPTYNERENVPGLVGQILSLVKEADVLLLDDNSPDGTADLASELFAEEPRFRVLRRTGTRGYGRSIIDGYKSALEGGYARVVQMDADFSHDPSTIPALIEASRSADVVIGSRYCEGGGIQNWPVRRRLLSRFANRYVSVITGLPACVTRDAKPAPKSALVERANKGVGVHQPNAVSLEGWRRNPWKSRRGAGGSGAAGAGRVDAPPSRHSRRSYAQPRP